MEDNNGRVSYSTKELLGEIKEQLNVIQRVLATKADQAAIVGLQSATETVNKSLGDLSTRVLILENAGAGPDHERRIRQLEQSDAIWDAQSKDRRYLYGALITLITVMVSIGGLLVYALR